MFRTPSLLRLLPLFLVPLGAGQAEGSALRWEAAAEGAAIVLPVALKARGIGGGTLSCREGEWSLRLRVERTVAVNDARISVGEDVLTAPAQVSAGTAEIALPARALRLLKDGTDVAVTLGEGENAAAARFPLAGSRSAIEAVAPLCSAPALPGFDSVRLDPEGDAAEAGRAATAAEAKLFREATGREPALAAGLVPADGGRALLFASLCGSNRYYGETGCKLMGFSRETDAAEWKPVFESEGMHLFRARFASHEGWPDLATVAGSGGERLRWIFRDGAYQPGEEAAIADAPESVIDQLRTGSAGE